MQDFTKTLTDQKKVQDELLNRKLDLLVEMTQTVLAFGITFVMAYLAVKGLKNEDVSNSFFLIIGFYFGKQFKDGISKVGLSIYDIRKNGTKTF